MLGTLGRSRLTGQSAVCRYQKLLASCSNITYQQYNDNSNTGFIEATDCVNGTWFQARAVQFNY